MRELKIKVLDIAQKLYEEKLVAGTSGNISVYDEKLDLMFITPSSTEYKTMEVDDIVALKLDGTIVEGKKKPSSEWKMHARVYIDRKDIKGVVHTHSPYATSFAVCRQEIPVILIEMVPFLGGDIKVAEFDMPGSEGLGIEALKVMSERKGCLLSNHGALAIGTNLDNAFESAIYLEDAAKIYHLAKSIGQVKVIDEKNIEKMRG